MNMTLVSLGGILMVAWNVFWVMQMITSVSKAKRSGCC